MFERFTDAARATTVAAQEAARGRGDTWICTEHLLLGVLAQPHRRAPPPCWPPA